LGDKPKTAQDERNEKESAFSKWQNENFSFEKMLKEDSGLEIKKETEKAILLKVPTYEIYTKKWGHTTFWIPKTMKDNLSFVKKKFKEAEEEVKSTYSSFNVRLDYDINYFGTKEYNETVLSKKNDSNISEDAKKGNESVEKSINKSDDDFDKINIDFAIKLKDYFKDKDGNFSLKNNGESLKNIEKLYKLKDFPDGLDLENLLIDHIGSDVIHYSGGGDWQDVVNFSIRLVDGELRITDKFESHKKEKKHNDYYFNKYQSFFDNIGSVNKSLDDKFSLFKKKIMDHLNSIDDDEYVTDSDIQKGEKINKSFFVLSGSKLMVKKSGYPIGTIRERKDGKKYIKIAPNKWRAKYDNNSKGAKLAIAAIKKQADKCNTSGELMKLVLEHKDRFSDNNGNPLPFVQELSSYVSNLNDSIELNAGKEKNIPKEKNNTESENETKKEETKKENAEVKEKTGLDKIKDKYENAKSIDGDDDEIQIGKEIIAGTWKLVEADTPTASHDEKTFRKTEGFPTTEDGYTVNDRDYEQDKFAQEAVMNIGSDYDGRALGVDNPIVVTQDGVVISGNNRTMSSKIAAEKGTDSEYIEALERKAKKFGFTKEQVKEFKNPRVVFEVDEKDYTTELFAKFNQSSQKEMGTTEKAVKISKLIKTDTVESIGDIMSEYETLGQMYSNNRAVQSIFGKFKDAGLVAENEISRYVENGSITEDGKNFVETALIGSVMNEKNIRGLNRAGCRSIRASLVRAITPLIENKGLSGFSINKELNEAVDIAMQVAINRDKHISVSEFATQQNMFEKIDKVAIELAKKLEGTQKSFSEFMRTLNGGLKYSANGEVDIFLGDVESKEDILSRMLNIKSSIKKSVSDILNNIMYFGGENANN
ncbi:MAG: hypothetical protein ACRC4W_00090, partial [Treponemataceae bacterium]